MLIVFVLLFLIALAVSCGATLTITWLICYLFGWSFTIPMGIGVWLVMCLVMGAVKKHDRK